MLFEERDGRRQINKHMYTNTYVHSDHKHLEENKVTFCLPSHGTERSLRLIKSRKHHTLLSSPSFGRQHAAVDWLRQADSTYLH